MPEQSDTPLGAVYTQRWVANLVLDRVGYRTHTDLTRDLLVEPCCGDGAFAVPAVERLLQSAKEHSINPADLTGALLFIDIDAGAVSATAKAVAETLKRWGVDLQTTSLLVDSWLREADFLLTADLLPQARWVVGNPPYLRVEDVPVDKRKAYRAAWSSMRGRADVYVGFWQAALSVLGDGGRVGYVCADRWMRNQYGTTLRQLVTEMHGLELLLDLHDVAAFERDVDAYPAVTIVARDPSETPVSVGKLRSSFRGTDLAALEDAIADGREHRTESFHLWTADPGEFGSVGWTVAPPAQRAEANRAISSLNTLPETGVTIRGGLATGADDVFIVRGAIDVEPALLRPIVGPSDFADGRMAWAGRHLVYPWTEDRHLIALEDYPRADAYLRKHETRLRDRYVVRGRDDGWWRTIDKEPLDGYTGAALLVPDIRERVEPVLDVKQHVPMHSLYRLTSDVWDLEVLGGVLLSDLVHDQMRTMSVVMASGRMRVSAQYLKRLRIPDTSQIGAEADALRTAFRGRDREAASRIVRRIIERAVSVKQSATVQPTQTDENHLLPDADGVTYSPTSAPTRSAVNVDVNARRGAHTQATGQVAG